MWAQGSRLDASSSSRLWMLKLLSEVEEVSSYLKRDDAFFYALVFDPHQKTLLADRGAIR